MTWGKLEASFATNHKFRRLANELRIRRAEARGLCSRLWAWAYESAPDGDLTQLEEDEIEEAADWEGERGAFVRAASAARVQLLDRKDEGYVIHGFYERAALRKEAQRKAEQRERKRVNNPTVYVLACDDKVKISYSANLSQRLTSYPNGERRLIATLSGDRELEKQIHRRFAAEREGRTEIFRRSPAIEEWLSTLTGDVSQDRPMLAQSSVPGDRETDRRRDLLPRFTPDKTEWLYRTLGAKS